MVKHSDPFRLDGKVAIVTGASTGLGQGICQGLAAAGAKIVGVSRTNMDETHMLVESAGSAFHAIQADLISLDPIDSIVAQTLNTFEQIDILVNNAGIIRREDALDFTEKDWDEVLSINTKSMFFLSQAVAKQYCQQGRGGKIINIASMLSFQGGIRVPSYTSSKSAVKGMTMALANEWAKYNINVNAIAPGYMVTNNTSALRADKERSAEILARIPAGRWGLPADIAGSAVFLASSAADYIHGFTLAVDGGWLAR